LGALPLTGRGGRKFRAQGGEKKRVVPLLRGNLYFKKVGKRQGRKMLLSQNKKNTPGKKNKTQQNTLKKNKLGGGRM